MKEFEAVELIPTHETGFIISIDNANFCHVVGASFNMRTPMDNLKSLGFSLQEFLSEHELVR